MTSFLQTEEWVKFQETAGRKTWRFNDGKIMANVIRYDLPFGKSYLYIPHGPELNFEAMKKGIKNELANFVRYLNDLAKEEGAVFIKIEPADNVVMELLHVKGMRRSSKQIQPYKTVVIDLDLPEDHLLGRMHPKTRYNIKVAEKHDIQVRPGTDIEQFWKLIKKTTARDKFFSHPKEYYEKLVRSFGGGDIKAELMFAYHGEKPVAGAIVIRYGDTGYYLHGASDHEFRSVMAPYALHWEIIKKLKTDGCRFYDLWGVDAKKWPGVTRFKFGWGGQQKEYPGSFDMVISRIWYSIYLLGRKIFHR